MAGHHACSSAALALVVVLVVLALPHAWRSSRNRSDTGPEPSRGSTMGSSSSKQAAGSQAAPAAAAPAADGSAVAEKVGAGLLLT